MPVIYPIDLALDEPLSCNNGHRRVPAYQVPASGVPLICSDREWEEIKRRDYPWLYDDSRVHSAGDIPLSELCKPRNENDSYERGYVRQKRAGRWVERRLTSCVSGGCKIRRLEDFVDFETGEVLRPYVRVSDMDWDGENLLYSEKDVRFMERHSSRSDNMRSVRESCERFKWLVRANERRVRLFVTLTYAENMRDTRKLYEDFRRFWAKVLRAFPGVSGYLAAAEPQKRGAWHLHVLLLSNSPSLYIPNRQLNKKWGHGFTKVQRVRSIRDVGQYLTSYLSNIKDGKGTKKGARLSLYPLGFRFARWSRNVRRVSESSWYGGFGDAFCGLFGGSYELCFDYQKETKKERGICIKFRVALFCKEKPK